MLNHKEIVFHFKICDASFSVEYQGSLTIDVPVEIVLISSLTCVSLCTSGGNNIDHLASIDVLNSFPNLIVRFY